jgi:galactitol-specific phosphotransferase system IIC component
VIRAFFRFWRDFIVGDDWRIAAGVTAVLAVGAVLVASEAVTEDVIAPLVGLGILAVAGLSIVLGEGDPRIDP